MKKIYSTLLLSLFFIGVSIGQTNNYWSDIAESAIKKKGIRQIVPQKYRTVKLNVAQIQNALSKAPLEFNSQKKTIQITLPMPYGNNERFAVTESPIMESALAFQFPNIKTYVGQGIDNPRAVVRFDWTDKGFHAMIISDKGKFFIDPYNNQTTQDYISYDKKNLVNKHQFTCHTKTIGEELDAHDGTPLIKNKGTKNVGEQLRTYRLACAATGEYTQFHGGTVSSAMSAIVTAINRVNTIYETEIAVRLVLIGSNSSIIYTNGNNDPYTNNNGGQMLGQNQNNLNSVIGFNNYDIGHVFSTGGGGIASLRSPCNNNNKARGVTGLGSPIGDPFYVDYVAHEMGHQFGANHTFNGNSGSCGGNLAGPAYEPGSATTIMGYAGICSPQNIQNNSDAFFHTASFDEIITFTQNGNGNNCAAITNTGNNQPNVIAGTGGYTIPINTPFELVGSATDINNDPLTYCWEQFDLGPTGHPNQPVGNAPIFRSFPPKNIPARTFPRIENIITGNQVMGEILPSYSRNLSFRLTARDNKAGGGGVSYDGISFSVTDNAGPFLVLEPNTSSITWSENAPALVQWDVANTDQSPVNCGFVDILLSTDGGFTYPHTLATNVTNNGAATLFVPNGTATTQARVRVQCSSNVFFDISDKNFTIIAPTVPDYFLWNVDVEETVCAPDDAIFKVWLAQILNYSDPITLSVSNLPDGLTATFSANPVTPGDTVSVTIMDTEKATTGNYKLTLNATSTSGDRSMILDFSVYSEKSTIPTLLSPVDGETEAAVSPNLKWKKETPPHTYDVQIATDINFNNVIAQDAGLTDTSFAIPTLQPYSIYYWRVRANNTCQQGEYSDAAVFRTAAVSCSTYTGASFRTIIPALAANFNSQLAVTDDVEIVDLNVVNVKGQHSRINDLSFRVRSPAGTTVELLPRICGNQDDFDINFDDAAADANYPCPPTDGGTYQPVGNLSDFSGESSTGTWTFTAQDHEAGQGGSIDNWELEICSAATVNNDDPVLVINKTLGAIKLADNPIIDTSLLATDTDNTPTELIFTIVSIPLHGELQLNGISLAIGDTFKQSDIDAGNVTYANTNENATLDSFRFYLMDVNGGFYGTPTFSIEIGENEFPVDIMVNEALLYPNPTADLLNVGLNMESDQEIRAFVFNALGQLIEEAVFSVKAGFNHLSLNTRKLSDGVYFLRIEGTSIEVTEKFMIAK